MKLILAFFRLIRWPNLVFIILTQLLFYYCIFVPLYDAENLQQIIWLIISSVSIASAGYIINDYFDLNIDNINKPKKNVINTVISRRWAIAWHLILNVLGLGATIIAVSFSKWYLIVANGICILLLWLYSTSFKRKLLIGNVVISLLTAWAILIVFYSNVSLRDSVHLSHPSNAKFFRVAFLYAGFAFIISLVREGIKDIEDMTGDERYGCKTMPIIFGIRTTKIYSGVWLLVLIAALIVLQLYVLQFNWEILVVYTVLFVISPLVYTLNNLKNATKKKDFAGLSLLLKLIMLTGILSMLFFWFYF